MTIRQNKEPRQFGKKIQSNLWRIISGILKN